VSYTYGILATWEAKIGKIVVQIQPRQKVNETPYQPRAGCSGVYLSSEAMLETKTGRIMVPG
jgi:hypothetical protein